MTKLKTQRMEKLKNSICDKTQKLNLKQKYNNEILTKLEKTKIVTNFKSSKGENSKNEIVTSLKTQIVTKHIKFCQHSPNYQYEHL